MKEKRIKKTTIEIVDVENLKVGDLVLWSNLAVKVVKINKPYVWLSRDGSANFRTIFYFYYRINDKEEVRFT